MSTLSGRYNLLYRGRLHHSDFGLTSPDEMAALDRYCKVYTNATNIDIDVIDLPQVDYTKRLKDVQNRAATITSSKLERKASTLDLEAMIELGLRKYTGYTTDLNKDVAMNLWTKVFMMSKTPEKHVFAARAACFIADHYEAAFNEDFSTTHLYRAVEYAAYAVILGSTAPAVLAVAQLYRRVLSRPDLDELLSPEGLEYLKLQETQWYPLFDLFDRREKVCHEADERREAKERMKPNAYRCAKDGCPVRATSQMGLKRCSGPCPEEYKPSYCSKECQRIDWKLHKKYCKPREDSSSASIESSTSLLPSPPTPEEPKKTKKNRKSVADKERKHRELKLNIAENVEISSSRLNADEMKAFHALATDERYEVRRRA